MAFTITMPKLGLTMNSGSVAEWKKQIGDPVKKGEILYVVATDKLTVDVESPADGVLLAITIKDGQEVPVGDPIGAIGEPGEKVEGASAPAPAAAAAPAAAPTATAAPAAQAPAARTGHIPSSPKAKKIAREKGIDLATVAPTGPNGWIVAKDVLGAPSFAAPKASPVAAKMAAEAGIALASVDASGSRIMKADVAAATAPAAAAPAGGTRRVPMTQMRRVIGDRMLASTNSIPSVHYFVDVDMTALNAMRGNCNARLGKKEGAVKVSVNDILMKFCAKLLLDCPLLNGSVEADAFIMHDYVNVGFAVALPGGLMVPNIKNVQNKGLEAIARERADLVAKTRGGGLSPDSMTGGTFTISNIGMMGVDKFTPIINPPEVAILGVGMTREVPVVKNGEIVIRPVATLCLAADHRLVDGADAAEFIAKLRDLIEDPDLFLL
ncbi:Catalytic domain of component of various dehydrogenase complexes [uncultured delta proteobacterium]|uniref:Dihydrolipoamide acetyltransferase component of pyruvate dehydrogenase complex n=1 Tax=uncultured delta proteobacterium TaxID=34034 RepID=A0A212JI67_9DELT|nr:Catalytic domain of component of various dehydrogenase complexes [uncultured delta proteobacterium]